MSEKNKIEKVLKRLDLKNNGRYSNHFYIIDLEDSNEYAKMYTKLCDLAINTEYPNFGTNTSNTTVTVNNYFEIEEDSILYNIFLIANFDEDKYYIKIKELEN